MQKRRGAWHWAIVAGIRWTPPYAGRFIAAAVRRESAPSGWGFAIREIVCSP